MTYLIICIAIFLACFAGFAIDHCIDAVQEAKRLHKKG